MSSKSPSLWSGEILNGPTMTISACLGMAHFTRRSLLEAYEAVRKLKPTDLMVKPNMRHFHLLDRQCVSKLECESCGRRCEFVKIADALGNMDAKILTY